MEHLPVGTTGGQSETSQRVRQNKGLYQLRTLLLLVTETLIQTGLSKNGMYSLTYLTSPGLDLVSFRHSWIHVS